MLTIEHRLRKTKEIERVWKSGRSFFVPSLQLKVLPTTLPNTRFAVVIGTKVHKRAVRRNLWKRRVREVLRKQLSFVFPGFDVVVSAKKGAVESSFADVEKSLVHALCVAGIVRKEVIRDRDARESKKNSTPQ